MALIKECLNDEQGAAMAEYALLVALIAVAVIGTLQVLAGSINAVFTATSTELGGLATP